MNEKTLTLNAPVNTLPILIPLDQAIQQVHLYILTFAIFVASEVLYRVLIATKEYIVNWKHYLAKHRFFQVLNYTFLKNHSRTYLAVAILVLYLILKCDKTDWNYLANSLPITSVAYVIFRLLYFTRNNVEVAEFIRAGNGIDYGSGMAENYFHGYLRLQLPETGHPTKGLKSRIIEYEDTEGVYFPLKKLFILIPQSMHAKPRVESEIMERVKDLETVHLDRAGVKRPFKNAVYRIQCEGVGAKCWYAALEYSTPIMSFYESLSCQWTSTPQMRDMRREITLQFYKALKKIIADCPQTKGLVELVYFNDITPDGRDIDVGEIVRERIRTLIEKNGFTSSH